MAFTKKTWVDRMVEFAGRRKLTNVSNSSSVVYDVERAEGVVQQEGTAFSAANMNDLETRIANAITATDSAVTKLNNNMGGLQFAKDIDGKWGYIPPESESQGADAVIPFKSITADSIVDSGGMSDGQNSSTDYSATEDCYICAFMSAGNMNTSQYTQTINGGTLLHTKTFGTNPKVTIGFVYLKKGEKITIRSNGSYQNTAHSEVAYLVLEL